MICSVSLIIFDSFHFHLKCCSCLWFFFLVLKSLLHAYLIILIFSVFFVFCFVYIKINTIHTLLLFFCFVSFCLNSSLKYTSLYCFMFFVEFYMLKQFLLPLCCFIFKFKIKFLIINQFLNSFLLNLNFLFSISLFKVGNKFSTFLYLFLSLYT